MWRALLLASVFALLGLGAAAYADCTSCLTSVVVHRSDTSVTLTFTASADVDTALPNSVTAVVMKVDGERTKCQNITLPKTSGSHGVAVYSGTFSVYGLYSHSGRVDLGGQIYEFTVPLDGRLGTIALGSDQSPLSGRGFAVQVTARPARATPAAVYLATAAPVTAPAAPQLPAIEPAFLIGGGLILFTVVGAYVDRRRALARNLAG